MPSILDQSRPSATSLMVKSNSSRATKSSAEQASRLCIGSTATLAPTRPIFRSGFRSRSICTVLMSESKEGVEVCITTMS